MISDGVNEGGIAYYDNLINEMLKNDIKPLVTLYHWDLPSGISNGWFNSSIPEYFKDYSDLMFTRFADRVHSWITFNEPAQFIQPYNDGGNPTGADGYDFQEGVTNYIAGKNILLSHGLAVKLYREKFGSPGKIGITLNGGYNEPQTRYEVDDLEAGVNNNVFFMGYWAHPIYKRDYPELMRYRIGERIQPFTEAELDLLEGSADFFGINYYTSGITFACNHWPWCNGGIGNYCDNPTSCGAGCESWKPAGSPWLYVTPWGIRKLVTRMYFEYGSPIFITENGYSTVDSDGIHPAKDADTRGDYFKQHINQLLRSKEMDQVEVIGYAAWSLMDNFEWGAGYAERFGIHWLRFDK